MYRMGQTKRWQVNVADFTAMHMSFENVTRGFKQQHAQINIKCQMKQLRKMTLFIARATSITFEILRVNWVIFIFNMRTDT